MLRSEMNPMPPHTDHAEPQRDSGRRESVGARYISPAICVSHWVQANTHTLFGPNTRDRA